MTSNVTSSAQSEARSAAAGPVAGSELWFVDLDRDAAALEAAERHVARLGDAEIARADTIKDSTEKRRWRAAHIALRLALERWAGVQMRRLDFAFVEGGRPWLAAPAPSFSLSHSAAGALIALARSGPVGIDLEAVAPAKMSAPRRANLEALAEALARTPLAGTGDARLLQAWTRIEALGKLEGQGIGRLLTATGVVGGGPLRLEYALQAADNDAAVTAETGGAAAGAREAAYRIRDVPVTPGAAAGGGRAYVAALAYHARDAGLWPAQFAIRRDITGLLGDI